MEVGDIEVKNPHNEVILPAHLEEEFGNKRLERVSSSDYLYKCAQSIGLEACIYTSPGQLGEAPSPKVAARAVEALLAAVWFDTGRDIEAVRQTFQLMSAEVETRTNENQILNE